MSVLCVILGDIRSNLLRENKENPILQVVATRNDVIKTISWLYEYWIMFRD